jgi:hypothetical protein
VEHGARTETETETETETATNTNTENTHPSQNRRRMGHPQRLGQDSEEWSSGIIRAGVAANCGEPRMQIEKG